MKIREYLKRINEYLKKSNIYRRLFHLVCGGLWLTVMAQLAKGLANFQYSPPDSPWLWIAWWMFWSVLTAFCGWRVIEHIKKMDKIGKNEEI
jgi:purine-cytosine permease-like protein